MVSLLSILFRGIIRVYTFHFNSFCYTSQTLPTICILYWFWNDLKFYFFLVAVVCHFSKFEKSSCVKLTNLNSYVTANACGMFQKTFLIWIFYLIFINHNFFSWIIFFGSCPLNLLKTIRTWNFLIFWTEWRFGGLIFCLCCTV